ncbi:MAG TPA: YdeI/OmpD-associated family protein [Longimicrobium sp.]
MEITFFESGADFRRWLEANHAAAKELMVGFYKKGSGKPSITYHEALDEALCFGWIDGVRKSVDDDSYTIRFTPRRPGSVWSAVNLRRAEELERAGRMAAPGLKEFHERDPRRSGLYSYENRPKEFDAGLAARFQANAKAWDFFQAQPPGYRRVAVFWVMEAKKEETRLRRLDRLIGESEQGMRLPELAGAARKPKPPGGSADAP